MNEIKRSIYYIFLFCTFIGCLFFIKINSFADTNYSVSGQLNDVWHFVTSWSDDIENRRFALYQSSQYGIPVLFSNFGDIVYFDVFQTPIGENTGGESHYNLNVNGSRVSAGVDVFQFNNSSLRFGNSNLSNQNCPIFSDYSYLEDYLLSGIVPEPEFLSDLSLDDFKVTSWSIGTSQLAFNSKFIATWSDSRISVVQVLIQGTNGRDSFQGSNSPFKGNFKASNFVINNGDTIQLIATPYTSNGSIGRSLYYTFTYNDHIPFSYIYRKLFKTRDYDNTVEIPYTPPGGSPTSLTLPVDGITENKKYEIKYNPTTNEIENIYNFDIDYNIIINYPEDLSGNDVINNTQEYVTNNFITNNYYNTEKNVNVDFDFDFGDVSTNDATDFKNDFDSWFDGLGGFIGKLAKFLTGLAPWLSPSVAVWIVAGFGFIVLLLTLLVVIKIVSFIRSLLPF